MSSTRHNRFTQKGDRLKVMTVFGTRPEAIKMAPVVAALNRYPKQIESLVCVTAQHRGMLDQVLALFDITPDVDLNLMQAQQDLTDITCRVLAGMRDVLTEHQPDLVLVHGDTTTTMATCSWPAFTRRFPSAMSRPAYVPSTPTTRFPKK
ncbi:MAG: UDP-N-acetylglucosamine 2-epimerase [Vampirovibrionales bacterium]